MIRTIFLDLDDVLNTLAPCVLNAVGCPIEPNDYNSYPKGYDYEVQKVASDMLDVEYTWKSFWLDVTEHTWATVPKSDFCDWLIKTSSLLVGKRNVFIATTPTYEPYCAAGKMEWIQKHCPPWLHRQFNITPCKWLLSQPDALLIDDHPNNISLFRAFRNGNAILVPRPWNDLKETDPKTHITACLEQFQFALGDPT